MSALGNFSQVTKAKLLEKIHRHLAGRIGIAMINRTTFNLVYLAAFGFSTIAAAQTPNPYAKPHPAPAAAAQDKGSQMDDLKSFATAGTRILDSKTGDLTGNGRPGALLVLEPIPTGSEKLGEGSQRDVVLLTRDTSGHLQKAASNATVVPCGTCGGTAGDPYGYARISRGQFTIANGGGSRERWSDEYTFTYAADKKDWFVTKVVRSVSDADTGKQKHVDLTTKELGVVSFKDFDPSKLPEVTLP